MSNPREIAEQLTSRRACGVGVAGAIWGPSDALSIVNRACAHQFGHEAIKRIAAWFWMLNRSISEQPDPIEMAVATLAYLPALDRAKAVASAEAHAAIIHTEEAPTGVMTVAVRLGGAQ